ncbi:D-lyxose/D-mannose family sugar isomerase [Tropicimonas sp. IMCC6043]|uniref:D-lyxose/D-mannose family sugar isomerase n=1 Tax=Tropicimonas sp. IMCC6043 TaxID=2510645 RepID=UPI00101BF40F|nr:D-lyxose/D-mannose family sugar isomerase [Tropicimonas sp. IMCC6043]RYH06799.1 D-lyxose/D-mannose family sugar isomerase [Tropicimonas sp. IMCC6043]
MKRSQINRAIARAEADFARVGYVLPGFAGWSLAEWEAMGDAARTLIETGHGWDVTDFNEGDFDRKGLLLFTVRNGAIAGGAGNRPYAEKIMIARQDQLTPMHRHAQKIEDIINRGSLREGATLAVKLFDSDAKGELCRTRTIVAHLDGVARDVAPGTTIELKPGESITLFPGTFHAFWGEGGDVVVGEVSSVNDDKADNFFAEPLARFSDIEEDELPYRPLVTDTHAAFARAILTAE